MILGGGVGTLKKGGNAVNAAAALCVVKIPGEQEVPRHRGSK